jgi:hypothetical protein
MRKSFRIKSVWRLMAGTMVLQFLTAGCSNGPPPPKTYPVSGTVLYKGLPVAGASVAFLGDQNTRPALGRTDVNGKFDLTTIESGDGAAAGTYKVTVSKAVAPKSTPAASSGTASMEEHANRAKERGSEPPKDESGSTSLLPEKYAQGATTDLSFEVKATGTNNFPIELKD